MQRIKSKQVFSGEMKDGQFFLALAEHLICSRGTAKRPSSPKRQTLHNIFLYLRVIHVTSIPAISPEPSRVEPDVYRCSIDNIFPSLITNLDTHGETLPYLNWVRSFNLVNFLEPTSGFEDIYGIPTSLFRLLCEANFWGVQLASRDPLSLTSSDADLSKQLCAFEERICNWSQLPSGPSFMFDFVEAMHAAVIVYFYRRVYRINATILQGHVAKVIESLLAHERVKVECGRFYATTCWPAFIAACEALSDELRSQVFIWFSQMENTTGMRMFSEARRVVAKVWQMRDQGSPCRDVSWQEVLYVENASLILS